MVVVVVVFVFVVVFVAVFVRFVCGCLFGFLWIRFVRVVASGVAGLEVDHGRGLGGGAISSGDVLWRTTQF